MIRTETICDQCSRTKRSTEAWWKVWISRVGFHVYGSEYDESSSDFPDIQNYPRKDICSSNCLMKEFTAYIDKTTNKQKIGVPNG